MGLLYPGRLSVRGRRTAGRPRSEARRGRARTRWDVKVPETIKYPGVIIMNQSNIDSILFDLNKLIISECV